MTARLQVRAIRTDGTEFCANGRVAWALQELVVAGERGCTAIETPGPRWSSYVHRLRHDHGLHIETVDEPHGGNFAGRHARYILRETVEIIGLDGGREAA